MAPLPNLPPALLLPQMQEWVSELGMTPKDPLHAIFLRLAEDADKRRQQMDRQEKVLAAFGPDAGKMAAEAARREVAQGIRLAAISAKGAKVIGSMLMIVIGTASGFFAGSHYPVATEIGTMPREMAEIIRLQQWDIQWPACRKQPEKDGVAWCLLPVVTGYRAP